MATVQGTAVGTTYVVNGRSYKTDTSGRFAVTNADDLVLLLGKGLQVWMPGPLIGPVTLSPPTAAIRPTFDMG